MQQSRSVTRRELTRKCCECVSEDDCVDADTDELLGGAIFGLSGDEVIHLVADVMYAKAPYTTISRAVHIHPTVAELVPTALQDLSPLD